jgi:hypothetical protein
MPASLEVADIFRRHGDAYRLAHDGHMGRVERRVMSAIELCRTAELGGHSEVCTSCGLIRCVYNSCRNRHCPKCQGQAGRMAGDSCLLDTRRLIEATIRVGVLALSGVTPKNLF